MIIKKHWNEGEYSSVRILNGLIRVLRKIDELIRFDLIEKILESERYSLNKLREMPHIQALRAIFELNEAV